MASNGYGFLSIFGREGNHVGTHRIAWVLANQKTIPHRHHICHTCDNPPCCNPAHLFLGSSRDNVNDANKKGHKTGKPHYGSANGLAKASDDTIRLIRQMGTQHIPQRNIARIVGLSQTTVWHILHRHTWKHVT